MQHMGSRDKAKREADRNQLNTLVGENVVRLSSLEGVDLEVYKSTVLPRLLEIIHNCKDPTSQQYIMDCIIQVFNDEYHIQTLDTLLEACMILHNGVDVKIILITLMDRISNPGEASEQNMDISKRAAVF